MNSTHISLALCVAITTTIGLSPLLADRVFLNAGEEVEGTITTLADGKLTVLKDGKQTILKYEDLHSMAFAHPLDGGENARHLGVKQKKELEELLAREPLSADAPFELLLLEEEFILEHDGTSTYRTHRVERILKEKGMVRADLDLDYLSPYESAEIEMARSIGKENVSYADTYTLKEGEVYSSYPHYNRCPQKEGARPPSPILWPTLFPPNHTHPTHSPHRQSTNRD